MAELMPKKTIVAALVGLLVLAGLGVAANQLLHRKTPDVHRGLTAPFVTSSSSNATTRAKPRGKTSAKPRGKTSSKSRGRQKPNLGPAWPFYGRSLDRTRDAAGGPRAAASIPRCLVEPWARQSGVSTHLRRRRDLRGGRLRVYRRLRSAQRQEALGSQVQAVRARLAGAGRAALYFPDYDGRLYALDRRSGKTVWSQKHRWHARRLAGGLARKSLRRLPLGQHARLQRLKRPAALALQHRRSGQARARDRPARGCTSATTPATCTA